MVVPWRSQKVFKALEAIQTEELWLWSPRAAWGRSGGILETQPLGLHVQNEGKEDNEHKTVPDLALSTVQITSKEKWRAECGNFPFLFLLLVT